MKKRLAALALSLLLLFLCLPASAAESVYFTAAGSYLLPLSDSSMPFWSGGYLYIPSAIFSGAGREALDVAQVLNNAQNRLVLYSSGRSLTFDLTSNFASADDGNYYYPGAIRRNGNVFVPAYVVTHYFDLTYSVIEVDHGSLVWVRQPSYTLSDKLYADAAKHSMDSVYAAYLRAKEQAQQGDSSTALPGAPEYTPPSAQPSTPSVPATPETPEDPEAPALAGRRLRLCIQADSSAGALLDVLESCGVRATFFASQDFLSREGGLLRRMAAGGYGIGLLADGADPEFSVLEQLEAGNQALCQATCGMTRLAYLQNASSQNLMEAEAEGCRSLRPTLHWDGLETAASADALLRRAAAQQGNTVIWLTSVSTTGLRALITAVREAGGQCTDWTETS